MHSSPEAPERRKFLSRVITSIHAVIGGTIAIIMGGAITWIVALYNWLLTPLEDAH